MRMRAAMTGLAAWALACPADPGRSELDAAVDATWCRDRDGDGHEDVDCGGDDCDDSDSTLSAISECMDRCAGDPHAVRCPCSARTPELCYSGPPGTAGIGECAVGMQRCTDGAWTPCEGERLPQQWDWCNSADDDCDGEVDEDFPPDFWCGCSDRCEVVCLGRGCPRPLSAGEVRGLVGGDDPGQCLTLPATGTLGTVETVFQKDRDDRWARIRAMVRAVPGATVRLDARTAGSAGGLADAAWTALGTLPQDASPFELATYEAGWDEWLAVRAVLASNGRIAPVLCAFGAQLEPPGE